MFQFGYDGVSIPSQCCLCIGKSRHKVVTAMSYYLRFEHDIIKTSNIKEDLNN